jgi:hypothetical protein
MPTTISVLTADMTCVSRLPGAGGGSSVVIKAAVGNADPPRCRNRPDDVRAIQAALNRFTPLEGGPQPLLVVDGLCGPKTRKAIYHFQEKWDLKPKNWKVPDGIVDPEGPTIQQLRKGGGAIPNLPAEFIARIPRVMGVITAARSALTLAKSFLQRASSPIAPHPLPALGLLGQAEARKVDRHFHVNKTGNPLPRLGQIETMFLNMLTAIGHVPQGVVLAADEPPSMAQSSFMFTFAGGYHLRGRDDTFEGIPVGSIYLCPKSRTLGQDGFTYAMIHELAHFTGPTANGVTDHAYFHKNPQRYRALPPDLAFHNADCYSQFAFDAIGKSDFNIDLNRS